MSAPAGLMAGGLLFWGHQTGLLGVAAPCAALLEAWRLTGRRFTLARKDFSRISDLSAVLFFGMCVYLYLTRPANDAFMLLTAWLPLAFVPLLASQLYSARGEVDVRALFVFMRGQPEHPAWTADISYPYLILCLLSAGAANNRAPVFYPAMALLVGWALWRARPAGTPAAAWLLLLALACGLGYEGQVRLALLQTKVEKSLTGFFFGMAGGHIDPAEAALALGHIGTLKQSERIALRVSPAAGQDAPRLLRAASYNAYRGRRWLAWDAAFAPMPEQEWAGNPEAAVISIALDRGAGLLPVPPGASSVRGLSAGFLTRSPLGAVKVENGPGLAVYRAEASARPLDGPPERRDLEVPPADAAMLSKIARELRLSARRPRQSLSSVKRYFDEGFRYSLFREGPDPGPKALEEFLLRTRSGHCEYFATASVLLLRSAGIPARFAAGYSVQEYSKLERAWVVRDRHAHAWTLAHVDGAWVELDTTPASWAQLEEAGAPWWTTLRDAASWAGYRFSLWRWSKAAEGHSRSPWVLVLAAALALFAGKELWALKTVGSRALAAAKTAGRAGSGSDSPWYGVERALAEEGFARQPWESWSSWLERLSATPGSGVDARELRPLLELHLRGRFDPSGMRAAEREALGAGVGDWLRRRRLPRPC